MLKEREIDLVSIIVSNYNNGNYIRDCLDSLINQSYKNIEIIVVDDCSTDNSVEVINQWIKENKDEINENKRVLLLQLPKNIGFSGAVTTGLYMSNGEYIAMQDGDDISAFDRIEKQVNYLKNNNSIKAVGSNYDVFTTKKEETKILPNGIVFGIDNIKEIYANGRNAVCYASLLFYAEIFDKVGGLTRRIDGAEDYEYVTKLLPFGLDNINEFLYHYRRHPNQRSLKYYGEKNKVKKVSRGKLHVLLVLDKFNMGGTETHVLALAKEFIKRKIPVTILSGDGEMACEFKKLNCRIYNMEFPLVVLNEQSVINIFKENIKKIIEDENITVVHAHQSPSGSLALEAAREKEIPFIFTIHGMYYYDIVSSKLPLCNNIISVSYPVYEWLLSFGIQSKVIPNGITYDYFNQEAGNSSIRKTLGIKDNDFVVMYCSRMAWGKIRTCENLIRVCRDLKKFENIEMHALLVGDGPGYDDLKRAGNRANQILGKELIHFIGKKFELADFYSSCDCVMGTGRVAIEAMASKKIVIASGNNGYFGIVTEENFEDAWKIYFGDHGSKVSNNAMYLYEDLKNYYINQKEFKNDTESIFKKSKEIFDITNVVEKVIDVYLDSF